LPVGQPVELLVGLGLGGDGHITRLAVYYRR
jgi:hypothetical protein